MAAEHKIAVINELMHTTPLPGITGIVGIWYTGRMNGWADVDTVEDGRHSGAISVSTRTMEFFLRQAQRKTPGVFEDLSVFVELCEEYLADQTICALDDKESLVRLNGVLATWKQLVARQLTRAK